MMRKKTTWVVENNRKRKDYDTFSGSPPLSG
jgi:hypothetical protein